MKRNMSRRNLCRSSNKEGKASHTYERTLRWGLALLTLVFLIPGSGSAGRAPDRTPGWPFSATDRNPVRMEIVSGLPASDGLTPVLLHLSIDPGFVILARPQGEEGGNRFLGGVDIGVEIIDSLQKSVARFLKEREISRDENSSGTAKPGIVQSILLHLPAGTYRTVLDVRDRSSNRRFFDDTRTFVVRPRSPSSVSLSDMFLGEISSPEVRDSGSFNMFGLGGDVPLGRALTCIVNVKMLRESQPPVRIRLTYLRDGRRAAGEGGRVVIDSMVERTLHQGLELTPSHGEEESQCVFSRSPDSSGWVLVWTLPRNLLIPGRYRMLIMIGDSIVGGKTDREFTVRWAGAPASLTDGSVAIAAMEYVLSPEAYHRLVSAPEDSTFDIFMEFWVSKDPSPETSINEALLEYYSRVDSTREKFADVRIADGFKTDRGKAYVLYGPPASVRRILTPGDAPAELWEYPHLAQRLVFEDRARRGEFVLVRIEPLRNEEVPR